MPKRFPDHDKETRDNYTVSFGLLPFFFLTSYIDGIILRNFQCNRRSAWRHRRINASVFHCNGCPLRHTIKCVNRKPTHKCSND